MNLFEELVVVVVVKKNREIDFKKS